MIYYSILWLGLYFHRIFLYFWSCFGCIWTGWTLKDILFWLIHTNYRLIDRDICCLSQECRCFRCHGSIIPRKYYRNLPDPTEVHLTKFLLSVSTVSISQDTP